MCEQLIFSDKAINSLGELRESFNLAEGIESFINGSLVKWLEDNYYEYEAEQLSALDINDKKIKTKICTILKVDYFKALQLTEEEKRAFDERKEEIKKYTSDEEILDKPFQVALNQCELAKLINDGETEIYLCHNDFSIPLKKSGICYIGVDNPNIENPFTKEQYQRAGITVKNITLPTAINPETEDYANQVAIDNGYDFFYDKHSQLTNAFHKKMKINKIIQQYRLPYDSDVCSESFDSQSECEAARNNVITKAYDKANKLFDTTSSKAISRYAAQYYSETLQELFKSVSDGLKLYCNKIGKTDVYEQIQSLMDRSYANLCDEYKKEITDNIDYYKMYKLSYFIDRVDIDELDLDADVSAEDDLLDFVGDIVKLFVNTKEYSLNGVYDSIFEMEKDLNQNAASFFNVAHNIYLQYISKIENLVESVGEKLSPMAENEDINTYLKRNTINS